MSDRHGRFVWYELMTTDTAAAKSFYGEVIGWGAEPGPPGMDYTLFTAADTMVAGLMDLPADARAMGSPPSWICYVAVDDVDSAAERMTRLGGKVHVPPRDIPDVGRFAVVADPQAAVIALFKSSDPVPEQPAGLGTPGHIGWNELVAADWEAAFPVYADLFGWQKAEAVDIGAMGTYQLFAIGGQTLGGMFTKPPTVPVPFWLPYFNVGDIDAAAGRVTAGGGRILNGPMQVPGGPWIVQGLDPQGAAFALLGTRA
jgi:predicted enzyme related to lactoylglutathione lyase